MKRFTVTADGKDVATFDHEIDAIDYAFKMADLTRTDHTVRKIEEGKPVVETMLVKHDR